MRLYFFFTYEHMRENETATFYSPHLQTLYDAGYTDGLICYFDLGTPTVQQAFTPDVPTVANEDFIDVSGLEVVPFDDDFKNLAGAVYDVDTTSVYQFATYFSQPTVQEITSGAADGAYAVIFTKGFQKDDVSAYGYHYNKARVFIYSPLTGIYTQYAEGSSPTWQLVSDLGGSASDNITSAVQRLYWAQSTNEIYEYCQLTSNNAALNVDRVFSQFGDLSVGGGSDVYPPYIIKEVLTNSVFGINPRWTIDETSYQAALAYCETEEIMVSTMYRREEPALRLIELLLATYGGFLRREGGVIYFLLQDASGSSVRTIDNDHLVSKEGAPPVTVTKGALQDTFNKIRVNYLDRNLAYRQNQIEIADEVDIDLFGVRMREFPPQFVMSEQTAKKIAVRGLWSNLYARDIYNFRLSWKDADLQAGDIITLVDSFHTALQSGVRARITRWKESEHGLFDVSAIMELEYANNADVSVNSSTYVSSIVTGGSARPALATAAYELPAEFSAGGQVYVGWVDAGQAAGAHLYVSADNVSFARALTVTPYCISGRFNQALPAYEHGWFDQNVDVYFFTDSGFSASSPTFSRAFTLDDVSEEARALGAGLLWCGSEMMSFEDPVLVGSNHYRMTRLYRGWGGTNIQAHNSGAYFHKHGSGVFAQDYNEDKIGTVIYYKVSPFNFAGIEYNVASISASQYEIQGGYYRPQVAPSIHTWIGSTDLRGVLKYGIPSGSGDLVAEWRDGARMAGFGAGGYGTGAGGFGRFTTDTLSHSWRVEVIGSGNAVVRSTVVTTCQFAYSRANNVSDNGAFRGNVAIKVTPFGTYGDAPRTAIASLQLFEQV
jgi:hypothetical protein